MNAELTNRSPTALELINYARARLNTTGELSGQENMSAAKQGVGF